MALQRGLNELYGLGYEFPEMFEKRINDVTVRDVQRVARKYLNDPVILRLDGGLKIPGE
jgi:predicted Zn-dependent peptidase